MGEMNWKTATVCNLIPYVLGNVGGTLIYELISPTAMIVSTMTLFPVVYTAFVYLYFRVTKNPGGAFFDKEWKQLTLYWIGLSIFLDALFWMFILPSAVFPRIYENYPSHIAWGFFHKERSYIWANYLVIILITMAGKWIYRRMLRRRSEASTSEHS